MEYLPLYSPQQSRRHDVKPGFSGWAQIHGRNSISWKEKFRLDVWYVDHQSFVLDVRIFLLTIWKVIRREGHQCRLGKPPRPLLPIVLKTNEWIAHSWGRRARQGGGGNGSDQWFGLQCRFP